MCRFTYLKKYPINRRTSGKKPCTGTSIGGFSESGKYANESNQSPATTEWVKVQWEPAKNIHRHCRLQEDIQSMQSAADSAADRWKRGSGSAIWNWGLPVYSTHIHPHSLWSKKKEIADALYIPEFCISISWSHPQ